MKQRIWPNDNSALWQRDFLFGVATAAYQIEGAGSADGRLPCIWDHYAAESGKVVGNEDGAVACDHYNRWETDLELIKDLGVDAYRLSIAWPRVMDAQGQPNPLGLAFYKRLLDGLKAAGIKTFVTLYHWDLPQWIQERGGWTNRETAYRFADYADLVTSELAGKVDAWTTFNEPWCSAYLGYSTGRQAPGLTDIRYATQAAHHLMLAHGLALPLIRRNDPQAQLGIVLNLAPADGASDRAEDQRAARLAEVAQNDWFLDPLLKGEYSADLFRIWPGTEPIVLPGDMETICQPMDYLGVNYYFRSYVQADGMHGYCEAPLPEGAETTAMGWEIYPQGLTDQLLRLQQQYPELPPIYITENGMASEDQVVNGLVADQQRVKYIHDHLEALDAAMQQGVDVRGYFAWSLMDNYEWSWGYDKRFGLYHVDYQTQTRTAKNSALNLRHFLEARRFR